MTLTVVGPGGRNPRRPHITDEHAGRLFDYLFGHPEGMTYVDAEQAFGWSRNTFFRVVRILRNTLAGGNVTIPCESSADDLHGPWIYRLTGDFDLIQHWHGNRLMDAETRLDTIYSVAESAVHATNGRTLTGRRARKIYRTVGRLREDLAELREDAM